jgi:hypothetical protein
MAISESHAWRSRSLSSSVRGFFTSGSGFGFEIFICSSSSKDARERKRTGLQSYCRIQKASNEAENAKFLSTISNL